MQAMIRYRVKPEHLDPCLVGLRQVYDDLAATQPGPLRYETFQMIGTTDFVVLVEFDAAPGSAPHHRLASFQRHRQLLDEYCVEPPQTTLLHRVGSYRSDKVVPQ